MMAVKLLDGTEVDLPGKLPGGIVSVGDVVKHFQKEGIPLEQIENEILREYAIGVAKLQEFTVELEAQEKERRKKLTSVQKVLTVKNVPEINLKDAKSLLSDYRGWPKDVEYRWLKEKIQSGTWYNGELVWTIRIKVVGPDKESMDKGFQELQDEFESDYTAREKDLRFRDPPKCRDCGKELTSIYTYWCDDCSPDIPGDAPL